VKSKQGPARWRQGVVNHKGAPIRMPAQWQGNGVLVSHSLNEIPRFFHFFPF